jgi:hypothetical protein
VRATQQRRRVTAAAERRDDLRELDERRRDVRARLDARTGDAVVDRVQRQLRLRGATVIVRGEVLERPLERLQQLGDGRRRRVSRRDDGTPAAAAP